MDSLELRKTLNKRHTELAERLERVRQDGRHAAGLHADSEEQAIELENDDVLAKLDNAIRDEMRQIEHTLERLDKGRYGICETCGKAIAPKRLQALPYATSCSACANAPGD